MEPEEKAKLRFLALGDSYTIGEYVAPSDRWPVQLAQLLRDAGFNFADPEIVARTGWTTAELLDGIDRANPAGPFDLVSLLVGVNDQYRGGNEAEYRREFAKLLKHATGLAGGNPSRVIVLSIPDWGVTPFAAGRDRAKISAEIDCFNGISREESERASVNYLAVTAISRKAAQDSSLLAADGLHPAAKMYREWAAVALPVVKSMFDSRP